MLLISRAGRDNWIGEAIRHIHHRGLLVSPRITCVYSTNAVIIQEYFKIMILKRGVGINYCYKK